MLMRSSEHYIHSRSVYTVLDFLGDVGGLSGILGQLLEPLLALFVPSLLTRSILNKNFKYDDQLEQTLESKAKKFPMPIETKDTTALADVIRGNDHLL